MKLIHYFAPLLLVAVVSCNRQVPPQPVNYVARFNQAASPAEKTEWLIEIADLDAAEAIRILRQLEADEALLAVDDQLNCIFHSNSDGATRRVSPGKRSSLAKAGDGTQLEEVRWLGHADGDAFGFPQQRYSVFVGKLKDTDKYRIFFLVFEQGRSGLDAGRMEANHYEVLDSLGMWPADWSWPKKPTTPGERDTKSQRERDDNDTNN